MKDEYSSLKSIRQSKEAELEKAKTDVSYPSFDALRKEKLEEKARVIFVVSDASGKEIRRIISDVNKGISRTTWNLRTENTGPVESGNYNNKNNGFLIIPGNYAVQAFMINNGKIDTLTGKSSFEVKGLNNQTLLTKEPETLIQFRKELAEFNRKLSSSARILEELSEKSSMIQTAVTTYPNAPLNFIDGCLQLKSKITEVKTLLYGDDVRRAHEFELLPGLYERFSLLQYMVSDNTTGVTSNQRKQFELVKEQFIAMEQSIKSIEDQLRALEIKLEGTELPYIRK
jgi:hypothetical protein